MTAETKPKKRPERTEIAERGGGEKETREERNESGPNVKQSPPRSQGSEKTGRVNAPGQLRQTLLTRASEKGEKKTEKTSGLTMERAPR